MAADPQEIRRRIAEQIGLAEPENRAPRRVFFRGRYLEFPPDTSDEEIEQTLRAPASQFLHVSDARGVPAPLLADLVERLQDIPLADFVAGGLLEALRKMALGMQVSPAEAGAAAADILPGAGLGIRVLGRRPLYRGIKNPEERELATHYRVVRGYGSAELKTPGTSTSVDPLVSLRPGFSGIEFGSELQLADDLERGLLSVYDIPVFRIEPEAAPAMRPILVADVDPLSYILRKPVSTATDRVAALSKPNLLFKEAEVFFRRDIPRKYQPTLMAHPMDKEELIRLLRDAGKSKELAREGRGLLIGFHTLGGNVPTSGGASGIYVSDPASRVALASQLFRDSMATVSKYKGERLDNAISIAMDLESFLYTASREGGLREVSRVPIGRQLRFGDLLDAAHKVSLDNTRVHELWTGIKMFDNPARAVEALADSYDMPPERFIDEVLAGSLKDYRNSMDRFIKILNSVDLSKAVREPGGESVKEVYNALVRTKVRRLRQRGGKARANRRER